MGAFICQISERDWQLSRRIGLYGNREMKPDGSGHLRVQDKMSVIRDLHFPKNRLSGGQLQ